MLIPTGFAQVNLKLSGVALPQGAQLTFGISTQVVTEIAEMANIVIGAIQETGILNPLSNALACRSVLIKKGPNRDGPAGEFPCNELGLATGDSLPPNVSMLVKKSTAAGGRMNQGRFFVPGAPEAHATSGGQLSGAFVTDMQNRWTAFHTELEEADMPMILLHSSDAGGDSPRLITSLSVQSLLATQRRRLR